MEGGGIVVQRRIHLHGAARVHISRRGGGRAGVAAFALGAGRDMAGYIWQVKLLVKLLRHSPGGDLGLEI